MELERQDDTGYWSSHWIIMRQMKRFQNSTWMKSYSHQVRIYPEWWSKYFKKYINDRIHRFAKISFAKSPGGKQIITI